MAGEQESQWHFHHLLKWLQTQFDLQASHCHASELSDGVAIANVLHSIDPRWFDETWLLKIKGNIGTNKILKVSNLKKVLERVIDFYLVHLDQRLTGFTSPDVSKIGESDDESELCRLLQLVLGCAVHCDRQEEFIQAIQQMEEDVQRAVMAAIQALPGFQDSSGGSLIANPKQRNAATLDFDNLLAQLEAAHEENKLLARQCSQLTSQISHMQDEIQHLQADVEASKTGDGGIMESLDKDGSTQIVLLKRQIQHLTDELVRSDSGKEEFRMKNEMLEQELEKLRMRHDELFTAAEQNRNLKDEVDILRERSARLATAEGTIDSMRKKVEEGNDLRRQLRKLEEKNAQYIQQNVELEEELKKLGPWKTQLELQKKQMADVQSKLDEERKRADKFEFQNKTLQDKFDTLAQEKERLIGERDKLKDLNEELKFAQIEGTMRTDGSPSTHGVDTLDMMPPEIKEKLLRLQHENRRLREQLDGKGGAGHSDKVQVLQTVIDGLQERIDQLEAENRKSNQRVLQLDNQLDEMRAASPAVGSGDNQELRHSANALKIRVKSLERDLQLHKTDNERLSSQLIEQEENTKAAQEILRRKDVEMQAMEERYKKYIEKAKSVLKTLDPKSSAAGSSSSPEVAALQAQIREKDRLIENLERETERHRNLKEAEDHLVTTAFYNLGMQLQRQAMEQRMAGSNAPVQNPAAAAPVAQGFLTRARQSSVRGKSSMNHGDTYQ